MADVNESSNPATPLLDGLRIVELGTMLGSSLAGMVLAEQGADVVRVVDPAQAPIDPVLDALLSRGKTEAALDLGKPSERETLNRLLGRADVVIESLGAPGCRQLGLDFEQLRARENPGLISCSLSAFPASDPRARLPGYEAIAGLAGFLYDKPLGGPRYHDFPVGSIMSGLFAANAVVAALIARLRLHRGQHIDTSTYQANLFAQVLQILVKTGVPRGFLPLKMVGTPFMSPWLCGDGRYVYLHVTLPAHNARILEILEGMGYASEVKKLRTIMSESTARDPSQVKSIPEAKRIRVAYEQIFRTRPAQQWEEILGKELCCIKVRTVDEWLRDSTDAGMMDVCTIEDPVFGQMTSPGPVATCGAHPPVICARVRGEASLRALEERWRDAVDKDVPRSSPADRAAAASAGDRRGPLQGIRVLDLSRVIAGPCAARVLAELGAEVVSVQNPTGLDWALSFHLVFNAGKKSVTLDFTSDEGKKKLWAILERFQPHAFIQNYRHLDVAKAVGVDPAALQSRFPSIVYTHLNAYGNEGGWQNRPGFEQVVQAVTGIQMAYARTGRPKLLPTPIIDIGSGLSGALATLLGLYHQAKAGQGSFGATHLTSTAVLFQIDRIAALQRERCLRHASDHGDGVDHDAGREITAAIVRALDGYACVAGPRKDVQAWLSRAAIVPDADAYRPDPFPALARRFWKKTVGAWQRTLVDARVSDTVVVFPWPAIRRLVDDTRRLDPGPAAIVRKRHYPGCPAKLTFVRSPLRMSLTPIVDVSPPPERGGDTREFLNLIGEAVPEGAGVVPYPKNKPLLPWLASFVRWGYFAWRSGNI